MESMRKVLVYLLIVMALLLSGCKEADMLEISGTVTSAAGNHIIPGATVVAKGTHTFSAVTGNDGKYRLAVPAGEYELVVTRDSFSNATTKVTVDAQSLTKNFALTTPVSNIVDFPETLEVEFCLYTLRLGTELKARQVNANQLSSPLAVRASATAEGFFKELDVRISYQHPAAFIGYRVYVAASAESPFVLGFVGGINGDHSGGYAYAEMKEPLLFMPETPYYSIQLFGPDGETGLTDPVLAPALEPIVLQEPVNGATVSSTPTLKWASVPEKDDTYRVHINRNNTEFFIYYSSNNEYTFLGLSPGTYYWSVSCVESEQYGVYRMTESTVRKFVVE